MYFFLFPQLRSWDSRKGSINSIPSHSLHCCTKRLWKMKHKWQVPLQGLLCGRPPSEKRPPLWYLQPEVLASFALIHKIESPGIFKWVANTLNCLHLIFMPGTECRPQHCGEVTFKIILFCSGNKHDAPGQTWESSGPTSKGSLQQKE